MAYVEMAVVVQSGSNLEGQFGYEYEDTGAAAGIATSVLRGWLE
jgi:hypothetical protein